MALAPALLPKRDPRRGGGRLHFRDPGGTQGQRGTARRLSWGLGVGGAGRSFGESFQAIAPLKKQLLITMCILCKRSAQQSFIPYLRTLGTNVERTFDLRISEEPVDDQETNHYRGIV